MQELSTERYCIGYNDSQLREGRDLENEIINLKIKVC